MTGLPTIASVVEGHGEVSALPVLLRRIAAEFYDGTVVQVPPPFRLNRNRMPLAADLGKAVHVQAARATGGGVLVVADADADCAVDLAATLRQAARPTVVEVCLAVREFEAWFLAAAESLRVHRSVRDDARYHDDPELPRGAKEALAGLMTEPYRETLHQPAFAAIMDLRQAQRTRSFAHLVAGAGRLLGRSEREAWLGQARTDAGNLADEDLSTAPDDW